MDVTRIYYGCLCLIRPLIRCDEQYFYKLEAVMF